jgi:hypothetical protein
MSAAGWIIMLASVLGMTTLFFWCIRKVLSLPEASEHIHSQSDIDPHDQE